jgi:hypothetical protein
MDLQYSTQNNLLLSTLLKFYKRDDNLSKILSIINGHSRESLRLIDWFVTNYAKKNFVGYDLIDNHGKTKRFKVYIDYKLKLKAYSKKRFDPFCRWDRIAIPYKNDTHIQTTIGQLNFFKWALENNILSYISEHLDDIEKDMNKRNSTAKNRQVKMKKIKTRKKRQELSCSATKTIRKEEVEIIVKFD